MVSGGVKKTTDNYCNTINILGILEQNIKVCLIFGRHYSHYVFQKQNVYFTNTLSSIVSNEQRDNCLFHLVNDFRVRHVHLKY